MQAAAEAGGSAPMGLTCVAVLLARKLVLLQLAVCRHAALLVPAGQVKHGVVEGVVACREGREGKEKKSVKGSNSQGRET